MGLQVDEAVSSTIELFLPVETLNKFCHLDYGQSVHMNAAGHMKEYEAEMVNIHIKRSEQNIRLQIEAPSLKKLLTDNYSIICYAPDHDTTKCDTGTSNYDTAPSLQDDLSLRALDEAKGGLREIKKSMSWHSDKKDTIKLEESETCDQVINRIFTGNEMQEENAKNVMTVVTRSMIKTQFKARIKDSQRSSLKSYGRLLKKDVLKQGRQQAACEVNGVKVNSDANAKIHEAVVEVPLTGDSVIESCGQRSKSLPDDQLVDKLSEGEVFSREINSHHTNVAPGYLEQSVKCGSCVDRKADMPDTYDSKNRIPTRDNDLLFNESVRKTMNNRDNMETENNLNGKLVSDVESKHKTEYTKRKSTLCQVDKKQSGSSEDCSVCDICTKSFKSLWQLNRHKAIKHAKFAHPNPLRCRYCDCKFQTARERRVHQFYKCSQNSNISEPFICQECSKPFESRNQMVAHMHHVHKSNAKMACMLCGVLYSNRGSLRGHMIMVHHTNTRHKCVMCNKVFPGRYALKRHMMKSFCGTREPVKISSSTKSANEVLESQPKVNTQNDESVLCPKCGKCFKTRRAVSSHLGSAHSKEWPFKCERCEQVFRLQKKLESHHCTSKTKASQQISAGSNRDGLQDDKNLVPCRLCNVAKINYNTLYKHLLSCHKQHPRYNEELTKLKPLMRVQCDRCGLDFSTNTNLRKHMKLRKCTDEHSSGIKSGKPCPFCAKISASITHLAQHMRLMHRQHPRYEDEERKLHSVLTIQCEICGNWYPDKESWRQHYTNAHAEDRLRCPYCRKPFRLKTNMQVHINHRHLGLPYKKSTRRYFRTCKHCPRSFLSKEELEVHVKTEHGTKRPAHQCDKCSFMYSEIREYFLHHRKVHSTDGIQCPGCSASFTSIWFLKKHMKRCAKTNDTPQPGNGSQNTGDVPVSESENVNNAAVHHLQMSDSIHNAEAQCQGDGENLVHIIPMITTAAVDSCCDESKEVICNNLLLSNVFDDCVVTDGPVQVSQVTEVTVDGTGEAVEEDIVAGYRKGIQVIEDNVATNEQVIYIPAGSSLDISQLPLGTVIETADGTTYWNGT